MLKGYRELSAAYRDWLLVRGFVSRSCVLNQRGQLCVQSVVVHRDSIYPKSLRNALCHTYLYTPQSAMIQFRSPYRPRPCPEAWPIP